MIQLCAVSLLCVRLVLLLCVRLVPLLCVRLVLVLCVRLVLQPILIAVVVQDNPRSRISLKYQLVVCSQTKA